MAHITNQQVEQKRNALTALLKKEGREDLKFSLLKEDRTTVRLVVTTGLTDDELKVVGQRADNSGIDILEKMEAVLEDGNYNNSTVDLVDVGYYTEFTIGSYDIPYTA